MRKYTPRKAGKRWLEDAPDYVLDVFDDPRTCDRYTVFFAAPFFISIEDGRTTPLSDRFNNTFVQYLGMSGAPSHPQGFSQWGELDAYRTAGYRRRSQRFRIRWNDLPEDIRAHVRARAESEDV